MIYKNIQNIYGWNEVQDVLQNNQGGKKVEMTLAMIFYSS